MSTTTGTTLVSLFHTQELATKAMIDLQTAGVSTQSVKTLRGGANQGSAPEQVLASLQTLQLPAKDLQVLSDGLKGGGIVLVVQAEGVLADKAEAVFERYHAGKIDERSLQAQPKAAAATANDGVISVIEEELVVGKRQVERGGMRVFSHMVETPVEEQVTLREEHATIERHAVNRPISTTEMDALQDQSFEVREMAEEAVVGKTARVVEEIQIGKESSEHTEKITDTLRKTQVDVDQVPVKAVPPVQRKS